MGHARIEDLPHYVYDEYVLWKGKWELIYGIPYAMTPAPGIQHQSISNNIAWQLKELLTECEACQALLPVDWKIDEDTVVQPDNLVICGKTEGTYLSKAPALIFEILSKSTAAKDKTTKFNIYEREGVSHYVIVDPKEQLAKVYSLHEGRYVKLMDATDESCEFDLDKCQISFDFDKIWT